MYTVYINYPYTVDYVYHTLYITVYVSWLS